ncbi:MAG: hypothetical protein KGI25_10305 [Thaumarchaeota archaeon]|nr:hypothetical protein [Nitrososphaerota archaeon]
MPQAYVRKLAKKHGTSTRKAEGKWAKAKASAAASGHADNYAYVTSIFKNMMHETPYIPTLKDLTRGMSFKYFLVAENDDATQREQSPEYRHLSKFPQFNELPFKIRRELEKEVRADGLIADYEQLEPEEKESVDDALQDMVIDKMQSHFGTGINIGDWSSTAPDEEPGESDLEDDLNNLPEPAPRRKERAPSHIAAMRGPHVTEPEGETEPEGGIPTVGKTKTYYKPWSALSDEQRAGRAKLAAKHGKLYRIKQSKWFRLLNPEQQQQVVDAVKAEQPIPKF